MLNYLLEILSINTNYVIEEPNFAFWPLLLLLGGIVLTTTVIIINATPTTSLKGKKLCVLGPQEAGKTKFFMNLQGKKYDSYTATNKVEYPEFDFQINGRTIKVAKAIDISGNYLSIKQYYEDLMNKNEIVIFLFNVKKYLYDTNYANDVRARLDFIWRHFNEINANTKKRVAVMATHADTLSDSDKKILFKGFRRLWRANPIVIFFITIYLW